MAHVHCPISLATAAEMHSDGAHPSKQSHVAVCSAHHPPIVPGSAVQPQQMSRTWVICCRSAQKGPRVLSAVLLDLSSVGKQRSLASVSHG